jgi:acetyl-CoA carboxylase biotin carboxylase subunit
MFRKVLVANRGEIAVRVIRACRDLGIETVAVYSEPDRGALHVRLADEAHCCGPARAKDSYLAIDALLEIADRSGSDAIHPGYGFLSENADFADACEQREICFIGPSSQVLRTMGDKLTSRRIMREAGLAVVPGSLDALADPDAAACAKEIGLPVMVKASGGGGGRGMRVVTAAEDLAPAIERARAEAEAAFGNGAVYLEKLIESPRHIEVQVLADRHGNAAHLFERECSIQRRHQKLVEEAPASGISPELRSALGQAALTIVRAVGYVGAGTVEFLMDADDAFYFLEMNTRLQVEHPVTEEVTRVDIVKEMIQLAAGERLSFDPEALAIDGHAIEVRIYAEDPDRNFLPSPGKLTVFRAPDGPGIRVDAGVQAGDTVTPHYDALLAKLVAWGPTRSMAIARLDRALAEFAVGGIKTSIPFHRRVLAHRDFLAGRYDTGFVDRLGPSKPAGDRLRLAAALVAIAFGQDGRLVLEQKGKGSREGEIPVALQGSRVEVAGKSFEVDAAEAPGGSWSLLVAGRVHDALIVQRRPGRFEVRISDHEGSQDFLLQAIEGA